MLLALMIACSMPRTPGMFTPAAVSYVQAADAYIGTFKNAEITLVLRAATSGYEGTATIAGQSFPVKASKSGNGIAGSFTVEGESYSFTARLEGNILIVESDGETHRLEREGAAPSGEPSKNPLKKVKTNFGEWKVFKHPVGVSFRYPGDWAVAKIEEGTYRLTPAGAGDDEIYLATGADSMGITSATDPMLATGMDQYIATEVGPDFKRSGKPEPIQAAATPGVAFLYERQGGNKAQIRIYTTILKNMVVSIAGIGAPEKLKPREDTLKKMFGTLVLGQSEIDKALVGAWTKFEERTIDAQSSGGRRAGDASLVSNANITVTLSADGTFAYRSQSYSIASGSGVFVENNSDTTENGTWVAGDGKLLLMWGDGSEEFSYRFEGDAVIVTGGGKEIVFKRR